MKDMELWEKAITTMERNQVPDEDIEEFLSTTSYLKGPSTLMKFLGGEDYIRNLAIRMTLFCFRNGPVEDFHAGSVSVEESTKETERESISLLSQEEMKILNKFMVDRLAYLLELFENRQYIKLRTLLLAQPGGTGWDDPDTTETAEQSEKLFALLKQIRDEVQ